MAIETPATDAFLAEVREQAHKEGAHFVANRMLAAWEAGFIDERRCATHELRGVAGMKKTWFHHTDCTTQQAEELMAEYQRRGVKVERNLNSDYLTWTVSARLPEGKKPPRINRRWQNRIWG